MRIKKMITKGELRPVLRQFLPTSTVRNVVCCVGRVEIQIEIQKVRCTANTDSIV